MTALELVIFDCDGVLVDSEPISNRVLAMMLCEQGLRITAAAAADARLGRHRARRRPGKAMAEIVL